MDKIISFFLPGEPPRVTAQEKRVSIRNGKPVFYDSPAIKMAKKQFLWMLSEYAPDEPYDGAVALVTEWRYGRGKSHKNADYKVTRPDTDNSIKMFKDCLTKAGFWKDDSQVATELSIKLWADVPGIRVMIAPLPKNAKDLKGEGHENILG